MKRLAWLLLISSCFAQNWSKWDNVTVGSSAGNIGKWNNVTIGTSAGNIGKWNTLTSPGGAGGGFTLVGSGGPNAACHAFGSPPASVTCPLEAGGRIQNGDVVIAFVRDGANTTTFATLSGGGAFTTFGTAQMNFGSDGYIIGACAVATGTSSGVTVTSPTGFAVRVRFEVWTGGANGCTPSGSPGKQASSYSVNGTAIDTGSSFTIATPAYVVGAIYGVNGSVAGGLSAGSGWTSPSTSAGFCDGDGNAFICTIHKLENSGTISNPNGTQATSDVRAGVGIALN